MLLTDLLQVANCSNYGSCGNTGSIRDDPCWTSRENSLELSSINKLSLVLVCSVLTLDKKEMTLACSPEKTIYN